MLATATNSSEITMKKVMSVIAIASLALVLAGCGKKEEGPAEKAGKQIDQTTEKMQQEAGQAMEKAGEKLQQAGEKAQ
jgi:PBP1b-binding outer membrane lipoprotein LpoB